MTLLATIESTIKETFNCYKCKTKYGKTSKMVAKTERARKSKGCFDFTSKNYQLENIRYKSCIGNFTVQINFLLEAFSQYQKGLLPFKGGLGEQPNKIVEIFALFEVKKQENIEKTK